MAVKMRVRHDELLDDIVVESVIGGVWSGDQTVLCVESWSNMEDAN